MTEDRRQDPRPLEELPFARQLEGDLVHAATARGPAGTEQRSTRRVGRTPVFLRRTAVLVAGLVLAAVIPVATAVLLSLFDDDGIPPATADLPVTGGQIEVVPMGQARGDFQIDLQVAPTIAQSIRVTEPTRVVAAEVNLTPPTVIDPDGTERFAPEGPPIPGTVTVGIWQAGPDVDLDGEVDLRDGFTRRARGSWQGSIPRQGGVRIELDVPTALDAGAYLVVLGFDVDPVARVRWLSVSGAIMEADGSGDRYPDGQAFRGVDRGDDGRWFEPMESSFEGSGTPARGDLQLWLRVN